MVSFTLLLFAIALTLPAIGVSAAKFVWQLGDSDYETPLKAHISQEEYTALAKASAPHLDYYEEIGSEEKKLGQLWLGRRLVSPLEECGKFSHYRYVIENHWENTLYKKQHSVEAIQKAMLDEAVHTLGSAAQTILGENQYNLGFEFITPGSGVEAGFVESGHRGEQEHSTPSVIDFPEVHVESQASGHGAINGKSVLGKVVPKKKRRIDLRSGSIHQPVAQFSIPSMEV